MLSNLFSLMNLKKNIFNNCNRINYPIEIIHNSYDYDIVSEIEIIYNKYFTTINK